MLHVIYCGQNHWLGLVCLFLGMYDNMCVWPGKRCACTTHTGSTIFQARCYFPSARPVFFRSRLCSWVKQSKCNSPDDGRIQRLGKGETLRNVPCQIHDLTSEWQGLKLIASWRIGVSQEKGHDLYVRCRTAMPYWSSDNNEKYNRRRVRPVQCT